MRLLKSFVLAAALACGALAMSAPTPAYAQGATYPSVDGVWQGVYWAADNELTHFQATLSTAQGHLTGSTAEVATFGDMSSPFLLGILDGGVRGDRITFSKVYDGTGGQTHVVLYEGRIMPGARRIVGTWRLDGGGGNFEMAR